MKEGNSYASRLHSQFYTTNKYGKQALENLFSIQDRQGLSGEVGDICLKLLDKLTSLALFFSVPFKPLKRRSGYWKLRNAKQAICGRLEKR